MGACVVCRHRDGRFVSAEPVDPRRRQASTASKGNVWRGGEAQPLALTPALATRQDPRKMF